MKKPALSRRDFVNGWALCLAAGSTVVPLDAIAIADAGAASPHTDAAIGEAFRAVSELTNSLS